MHGTAYIAKLTLVYCDILEAPKLEAALNPFPSFGVVSRTNHWQTLGNMAHRLSYTPRRTPALPL